MNINVNTRIADSDTLYARAPGKIILSGEHSVVYGADALAVAVAEYTTVNFSPVSQSKVINTLFSGISTGVTYPINALSNLKHRLDQRFEQFTNGDLPVQNILNHPNDLVMYTLMSVLHQLPSRKTLQQFAPHSGVLRSESSIPTGAGMGSSASAIAATLVLYESLLERPMAAEQRFEKVRFCERLQHGRGSAIDAATVVYGGVNHVRNDNHSHLEALTLGDHWFWLHTGTPSTTTGECVQFVRRNYANDTTRWQDFSDITQALQNALRDDHCPLDVIKSNHRLLQAIGVVPARAEHLINAIEALGGAAKISGAGAVAGESAGLVLMYLPNVADKKQCETLIAQLQQACDNSIQSWGKLRIDTQGAIRVDTSKYNHTVNQ